MPSVALTRRPVFAFAFGGALGALLVLIILLMTDSVVVVIHSGVEILCVLLLGLGIGVSEGFGFLAGRRRNFRRGARRKSTRIRINGTILLVLFALCFLYGASFGAINALSIRSIVVKALGDIGRLAIVALTTFALGAINGMATKSHVVLSALLGGVFGPLAGAILGIGVGVSYYAIYLPTPCAGCINFGPVAGTFIVVAIAAFIGLAIGIIFVVTAVMGSLLSRRSFEQ